jgi:hypothetical protein
MIERPLSVDPCSHLDPYGPALKVPDYRSRRTMSPIDQTTVVQQRRSFVPYILAGIALFVGAFALGSTQGDEPSTLNTLSAVLGTGGALLTAIAVVAEVVSRVRRR